MGSAVAKTLFALLVVAGASVAIAQAPHSASNTDRRVDSVTDATADTMQRTPLLLATNDAAPAASGTASGKPLLMATNTATSAYSFGRASRRPELTAPSTGSDVKEWMLIAMGIFLIGAMSHRRSRSFTD